jgi:hypothetical protein
VKVLLVVLLFILIADHRIVLDVVEHMRCIRRTRDDHRIATIRRFERRTPEPPRVKRVPGSIR